MRESLSSYVSEQEVKQLQLFGEPAETTSWGFLQSQAGRFGAVSLSIRCFQKHEVAMARAEPLNFSSQKDAIRSS